MPNVKIYSTQMCPYCVTLKAFLKEQNVEFEEIDVSEDEKAQQEMIEKSNQMAVPVVEINGQIIIGFDRQKIKQILNLRT